MRFNRAVLLSNFFSLLLLFGVAYGALHWREAVSYYRAQSFQPTPELQAIVENTAMTPKARNLLYGSNPEIVADRSRFDGYCRTGAGENIIELGCYTPSGKIYLLDLGREELSDIINVTAAHEMLHAAYAQLPIWRRQDLNRQLEDAASRLNSKTLDAQLKNYSISEPGQRHNELHSLLGTEHATLTPELEEYYAQFFSDRRKVVAYNQQFEGAFAKFEQELSSLRARIDSLRRQMDRYESQGNVSAYNKLVPEINQLINQYNQSVAQYNSLSRSLRGEESTIESEQLE